MTILVNPEDMDTVRAATTQLMSSLGGIESCDVQAERRVSRGGAVVRTAEGEVDASLETKLSRARDVIVTELGQNRLKPRRSPTSASSVSETCPAPSAAPTCIAATAASRT